jgi:hypothetical protein
VLNQRAAARFAFNCIRSAAPRPPPLRRPTRRRSPMSTFETSTNQRTSTTTYNHNDGPFRPCSNICLQHSSNHPSPENQRPPPRQQLHQRSPSSSSTLNNLIYDCINSPPHAATPTTRK